MPRRGSMTHRKEPVGRAAVGFFALAGPPILLSLDTAIAAARGWRPQTPPDIVVVVLLVVVVAVLIVLAQLGAGRAFLGQRSPQMVLLSVSIWGTWAIIEIVLAARVQPLASELFHRRKPGAKVTFRPRPELMPGITGESNITRNSIGLRGPEMPTQREAYRIICIGGSTTECLYLDDRETWPYLLMQQLNQQSNMQPVWVGNAGIIAFTSAQHLRFIQESELMNAIDCLVILMGINDFLLGIDPYFFSLWDRYRSMVRVTPVWHRSRVLALAREAWNRYGLRNDFFVEDPTGSRLENRRLKRLEAPVCDVLPPLDRPLREYEAQMRAMINECRVRHVVPLFLTQPVVWCKDLSPAMHRRLWQGALSKGQYLSVERLREGMDRYNLVMRSVCRQMNVACIDLTSMNGHEEFFYDDCHFTEAGAREVARLIAQWFLDHRNGARWNVRP